jgi:hypothetical protein
VTGSTVLTEMAVNMNEVPHNRISAASSIQSSREGLRFKA